jgi:hypothetical protein
VGGMAPPLARISGTRSKAMVLGPNDDDDRSEEQRQADNDNHANQCNPNNDEYWNSRGVGDDE